MNPRRTLTRLLAPALFALVGAGALPAAQAADVSVSIGFSQPGAYGRVDIGRYPQPVLVAPRPVIIGQPAYREPVYLWVPPGHRRDWRRNCYRYNACGAQVYFVEDNWYRHHVAVQRPRHDHRPPPPPPRRDWDRDHRDHGRHDRDRDRHDRDGWRGDERRGDDRRNDHR